jgi:hypothetical protein
MANLKFEIVNLDFLCKVSKALSRGTFKLITDFIQFLFTEHSAF